MRIVYISNSIIPSRLANSVHVMEMCQAFAKNGHRVVLLAPNRKKDYELGVKDVFDFYGVDPCFEVVKLPCPNMKGKAIPYAIACSIMLKKYRPDLVFGRFVEGCLLAALTGHETIIDLHGPIWETEKNMYLLSRRFLKNKSIIKIIVSSRSLKEMYLDKGFLREDKIQIARNGARILDDYKPIVNWIGRSGVLQVGYVGHLYKGRGVDLILACADKIPDADFHVIGGTKQDISYWNDKPRSDNVYFHGYIPHGLVYKYRNSCDVLLAPYKNKVYLQGGKTDSSRYMSPIKLIEYMSSRKAIIASDLPTIREVLGENNSILVDPEHIQAWVRAIKCLKSKDHRRLLGNNAYQDFLNHYTWQERARTVLGE